MSRLLIGSSNIRRFYGNVKDLPKYKMETATVYRAFEVSMTGVVDGDKVVISVLENFIEKAVSNQEEASKSEAMIDTLTSFMRIVSETAARCPTARFALAYPIRRPSHEWMTKNEEEIRSEFEKSYNTEGLININKIDAILGSSQIFEKDGTHLTAKSGLSFVTNLIEMAEGAFEAEAYEEADDSVVGKIISAGKDTTSQVNSKQVQDLRKDVTELKKWSKDMERQLNSRFACDNLIFARLREEMDAEANRKKEDRTLVMGFKEPVGLERGGPLRNEKIKKIVQEFCKKVKPDFDGQILFAATMGRPEKGKIRIEFRLDSIEKAREIRKIFAMDRAAKKIDAELEELQVITVVTLATRIRLDIMKAVATKLESATQIAYVPNFLPRPIMHIKKKSTEGDPSGSRAHLRTLTFVDCIIEHGGVLEQGDLTKAYEKAKNHFKGTMRQHFLVLEEGHDIGAGGATNPARGVKRPNRGGGESGRGKFSRV
jgi:hypothetical protein